MEQGLASSHSIMWKKGVKEHTLSLLLLQKVSLICTYKNTCPTAHPPVKKKPSTGMWMGNDDIIQARRWSVASVVVWFSTVDQTTQKSCSESHCQQSFYLKWLLNRGEREKIKILIQELNYLKKNQSQTWQQNYTVIKLLSVTATCLITPLWPLT